MLAVSLTLAATCGDARLAAFRHEPHGGPWHIFGYHLQVGGFDRATAVAQLLTDLRAHEPSAPVFITSDGGSDLTPIAAHFKAHYYYDPVVQLQDHTEFCNTSLSPAKCTNSKGNITTGNYGNPIR